MPKFKITLEENVWYELIVEADTEEEAAKEAEAVFVQTDISKLPTHSRERSWVHGERAPDDAVLTDTHSTPVAGGISVSECLAALKRAEFVMASPTIIHLTNGGGALDAVREAILKAGGTL